MENKCGNCLFYQDGMCYMTFWSSGLKSNKHKVNENSSCYLFEEKKEQLS